MGIEQAWQPCNSLDVFVLNALEPLQRVCRWSIQPAIMYHACIRADLLSSNDILRP